jgi:hypothetical protein
LSRIELIGRDLPDDVPKTLGAAKDDPALDFAREFGARLVGNASREFE